jgi:hypothetical protein
MLYEIRLVDVWWKSGKRSKLNLISSAKSFPRTRGRSFIRNYANEFRERFSVRQTVENLFCLFSTHRRHIYVCIYRQGTERSGKFTTDSIKI